MDKEKQITKLIKEISEKRMTVSVKNVVIYSVMQRGDALSLADDSELIQSIINKTNQS